MDEPDPGYQWSPAEQPGPLVWLQGWYATQCDGAWEHGVGVTIDTLDNLGWSARINLEGTDLHGRSYERHEDHRSEHEWCVTWVEGGSFNAACGPLDLGLALHRFGRSPRVASALRRSALTAFSAPHGDLRLL